MVDNTQSYIVGAVASVGGLLFGYDIGVISSILEMDHFKDFFNDPSSQTIGLIVSFLTLGCFIGSFAAGQLSDRASRRRTIQLGGLLFSIGGLIQTFSLATWMLITGRFVSGLGVGMLSAVVPSYQSEVASPEIRGGLISLQQWAITWGILISFWVDYGFSYIESNLQWRLPLLMQFIPGMILLVSMFFMPYSPRWLVDHDRVEEARVVLARLRSHGVLDDPAVSAELDDIVEGVRIERETSLRSYAELFRFPIRRRMLLGITLQIFQQLTGINVIMYYAPTMFQQAGFSTQSALLAQGINGIVNVSATIPAILYLDKWGRRFTLILGSFLCGTTYLVMACVNAFGSTITRDDNGDAIVEMNSTANSYIVIIAVYCFVASFAFSWGPIGWVYPAEIFPTSMRAKGNSLTTAANWLCNFVVGLVAPTLMAKYPAGLDFLFTFFMYFAVFMVYFLFPETKGRSLEEMEIVFSGSIWVPKNKAYMEKNLQKNINSV